MERPLLFQKLEGIAATAHELLYALHAPVKKLGMDGFKNPDQKAREVLTSQTTSLVHACLDTLTTLNPGTKYTLSISREPQHDMNYDLITRTGEEVA